MRLPDSTAPLAEIYDLLYGLGLTGNSVMFFYTAYAVWLCVQQPERLLLVTKWLYPEVAKHYHTTPAAVERSIRRAANTVLTCSFSQLAALMEYPETVRPRTAQFLALLASCIPPPPAA